MPHSSDWDQILHFMSLWFFAGRKDIVIVTSDSSVYIFSDCRAQALHYFRRPQRAEAGSEALWWLCHFFLLSLVSHGHLLIWNMNKDLFFVPFSILLPLGSAPCDFRLPQIYVWWHQALDWPPEPLRSMCVWFSQCSPPGNSPTSPSHTAGTERPFSSYKLWYPRRRVG